MLNSGKVGRSPGPAAHLVAFSTQKEHTETLANSSGLPGPDYLTEFRDHHSRLGDFILLFPLVVPPPIIP